MIVEYSYDEGEKIRDLLNRAKLVTLNISKNEEDGKFYIVYTTVDDYSSEEGKRISAAYKDSLSTRVNMADLLCTFAEKYALGNVLKFSLDFDAITTKKLKYSYTKSFRGGNVGPDSTADDVMDALEKLKAHIIDTGSGSIQLDIYRKEVHKKQKRYIQLTLGDVVEMLIENVDTW